MHVSNVQNNKWKLILKVQSQIEWDTEWMAMSSGHRMSLQGKSEQQQWAFSLVQHLLKSNCLWLGENESAIIGLQENAGTVHVLFLWRVFASHLTHTLRTKSKYSDILIILLPLLCCAWFSSWEAIRERLAGSARQKVWFALLKTKQKSLLKQRPARSRILTGFDNTDTAASIHSAHSFYL